MRRSLLYCSVQPRNLSGQVQPLPGADCFITPACRSGDVSLEELEQQTTVD